jgi:acyl-CoA reductase-like NAD-dependent aldehyde dehydrogenase
VPLLKFSDVDEVVARANATPFGLAASVWGTDIDAAQAVADRIEAGTVWINTIHELGPDQPFGGHKQSGLGAENGRDGLLEFTCPQVMIRCT